MWKLFQVTSYHCFCLHVNETLPETHLKVADENISLHNRNTIGRPVANKKPPPKVKEAHKIEIDKYCSHVVM